MQKTISSMTVGEIASLGIQVIQCVNESNVTEAKSDATFTILSSETEKMSSALIRENNSELVALKDQMSDNIYQFYVRLRTQADNEQHSPDDEIATNAKIVAAQFSQIKENLRTMKPHVRATYFKTLIERLQQPNVAEAAEKAHLTLWVAKFNTLLIANSRLTIDKRTGKDSLKSTATATSLKPSLRKALKHFFNFVAGRCDSLNDADWTALNKSINAIYLEVGRAKTKTDDTSTEVVLETATSA